MRAVRIGQLIDAVAVEVVDIEVIDGVRIGIAEARRRCAIACVAEVLEASVGLKQYVCISVLIDISDLDVHGI